MNVLDNIENGKYKNTLPYPEPLPKTDSISQNEKNKAWLYEARKLYRENNHLVVEEFYNDLEVQFELDNHYHKKIWFIAWGEGHSDGLEAVYHWYNRLADIVKD